jgi:hypothetical protein
MNGFTHSAGCGGKGGTLDGDTGKAGGRNFGRVNPAQDFILRTIASLSNRPIPKRDSPVSGRRIALIVGLGVFAVVMAGKCRISSPAGSWKFGGCALSKVRGSADGVVEWLRRDPWRERMIEMVEMGITFGYPHPRTIVAKRRSNDRRP